MIFIAADPHDLAVIHALCLHFDAAIEFAQDDALECHLSRDIAVTENDLASLWAHGVTVNRPHITFCGSTDVGQWSVN